MKEIEKIKKTKKKGNSYKYPVSRDPEYKKLAKTNKHRGSIKQKVKDFKNYEIDDLYEIEEDFSNVEKLSGDKSKDSRSWDYDPINYDKLDEIKNNRDISKLLCK